MANKGLSGFATEHVINPGFDIFDCYGVGVHPNNIVCEKCMTLLPYILVCFYEPFRKSVNLEDPPMTWRAVANNHGISRFRGTLRIGLFTTPSIHGLA